MITLIPKKGMDLVFLKNWRPITLLNTDYKILARVVSNRITPYLPKLIHDSQTGFMKNRNISHDVRKIIDIMQYVQNENIDALLISLDFEKAFDRVEIKALIGTLENFNFVR